MDDYSNFSYWFSDTIVDTKGKTVCDINKSIKRIFTDLVSELNNTIDHKNTKFVINDHINGKPDAIAATKYNNDRLWWYVCLSNNLENPIEDFIDDKVFYAFEQTVLNDFATQDINQSNSNDEESKIGKIIELN